MESGEALRWNLRRTEILVGGDAARRNARRAAGRDEPLKR